jgi:predicted TIM-barrel fold metal-dependent hydrolase
MSCPAEITRRDFFAAIGMAGAAWMAGCATKTESSGAAIDTHTHFYDPSRPQGVPWPAPNDPLLFRTVLPPEYRALAEPLGIGGTIVVEASARPEDNDWVLELAERHPCITAFIGHLKPGLPGFAAELKRLARNRFFRGIRTTLWNAPVRSDDPELLRDLALLADRGLTLDVLGGPDDLPVVAKWSSRIPDLSVVIDHCANVPIDGGLPPAAWREGIQICGEEENIVMKISGLVEGTGQSNGLAPADPEFYRPVLDAVWSAFGEDRVIYGSNWPVCERYAPLTVVHQIVMRHVQARAPTASAKLFRENASRVYRFVERRQRV